MMLTEKECKEALSEIEDSLCELEETKTGVVVTCLFDENLETIKQLIDEHFDNPPLKIEEIKKYEPVFDNENLGWILVSNINKVAKYILCLDVDGNRHVINFKENRFYRKEVQE